MKPATGAELKNTDLFGVRFGKLLVIARSENNPGNPNARWDVLCDCGNTKTLFGFYMKQGHATSCGCEQQEKRDAGGYIRVDVGFVSGFLTVLGVGEKVKSTWLWKVRCVCGTEKSMRRDWLASGRVKSCGCMKTKLTAEANRTHGMCRTREYDAWCGLKRRCFKLGDKEYPRYGGRGITVCDRWVRSFENFIADMGPCPAGYEIDRRNVNGNYEPNNCRWVPYIVQMHNLRTTKLSMSKAREIRRLKAEGHTYKQLSEKFGVSEGSIGFVLSNKQWKEGVEPAEFSR